MFLNILFIITNITLEELKKIDPSNINYMTFTDGSVAIINSDSEDEEKVQKEEKKEKNIEQKKLILLKNNL